MDRDKALKLLRKGPKGVRAWNSGRERNKHGFLDLQEADLSGAYLRSADLRGVNLRGAVLRGADLQFAKLQGANLRRANLQDAHLQGANFKDAKLQGADLQGANLILAILFETAVEGANFRQVSMGGTTIACDLSEASGLDEIGHFNRSIVNVNSILCFNDELPEAFLRGCGLREHEIAYFRSQIGTPIRFYSCFISYSSRDEAFATRLHNDFQAAGIRCWKWNHNARTGRSLWGEIDQAIRVHDKLVLVTSESSLRSPEVQDEIERAIQKEKQLRRLQAEGKYDGDTDVLFPVRVDDYIFDGWEHERKVDVTRKVIADARNWTDPKVYKAVLDRLIRDLKPT